MIDRVHFLKLKPAFATPEERAAVVRRAVDELCTVPGVVRVTAGVPRDAETAATWDVVIVVRFPGMAEVEAYRPHPTHRHFVDGYMAPRLEAKTGWMFEVVDGTVRDHAS